MFSGRIPRQNHLLGLLFLLLFLYLFNNWRKRNDASHSVITTAEGKSYTLAMRLKSPHNYSKTIILLHSEKLDSTVWENIKTLDILSGLGYRAIAIDLPGFGNSRKHKPPEENFERAAILEVILQELNATDAVLVVPSMSGTYALPLIVRGSLKLSGFVAIAPYHTDRFTHTEYSLLKIPTIIIYGSADSEFGENSSNNLQHIPDSKIHVIKGASHACYLQNPDEFHDTLKTFLEEISTETFDSIRKEHILKQLESQH